MLIASFVDGEFINDSTLTVKLIYHNKGNQYSTVLQNNILFYSHDSTMEEDHIMFSIKAPIVTTQDEFDPVALLPGQQIYREINQPVDFAKAYSTQLPVNLYDTIHVILNIGFIDRDGHYSHQYIKIGWLALDKYFKVKFWQFNYDAQILESGNYFTGKHLLPR